MTSDFYVYALFRENGAPFYIGKGRGHRWACHEWDSRKGVAGHKHNIIRAMHARGIEVIKIKLHEELTEATALAYETVLIAAVGRYPNGPLTNLTEGGEGTAGWSAVKGKKQSASHVAKRMAAHIGKTRSPTARANMGDSHRGKPLSADHRAKLADINRGKKMSPESIARSVKAHLGKKRTDATRANISAAKLGKKLGPQSPEHTARAIAIRRRNFALRRQGELPRKDQHSAPENDI